MLYSSRNSLKKPEATDIDFPGAMEDNTDIIDAALAKCNFTAAADPTVNDDSGDGYATGSRWHNTTLHKIFICEDATEGAAVWRQIWPLSAPGADFDFGSYEVRAQTFESDVATGTAPFTIASTTVSTNLNADLLDGEHAAAFAVAAKGVTNGDSHDHAGGDGAAIVAAATFFSATAKVLGRKTASAGVGEECSPSEVLDLVGTAEQGDILYRGASSWALLPHGTTGQSLRSGGHGVNPSWSDDWIAETNFTATPASTSTITMTADRTTIIKVGYPVKYTIGGTVYYGIVTAIASNLLTIAGAPLGGDVTALYWADPTRVVQVDFVVLGTFADAANTTLLATDARTKFSWGLATAYCVQIKHTVRVDDTGANQPQVTISINGSVVGTDNTNAGLAVAETWTSTVVGINTSNYDINKSEAIEIVTDANGSNDDAVDLTVSAIFVIP